MTAISEKDRADLERWNRQNEEATSDCLVNYTSPWQILAALNRAVAAYDELAEEKAVSVDDMDQVRVLGMTVAEIARLQRWFQNKSGKTVSEFWQEAFDAGVVSMMHAGQKTKEDTK